MAIIKDPNSIPDTGGIQPIRTDGWPKGMNNVMPDYALPDGTLRDAVNVDINDAGKVRRRDGRTQVYSGTNVRGLWRGAGRTLFAEGAELKQLNPDYTASTLAVGLATFVSPSFIEVNGVTYWSDGVNTNGTIRPDGTVSLWGIPPGPKPNCVPLAGGGLPGGTYRITTTYELDTGEEGGNDESFGAVVQDGGSLLVTGISAIAPHQHITRFNVYVTLQNGEVFYHYGSYPIGVTSITITPSSTLSTVMGSWGSYPYPACSHLEYHKGRIFGAVKNIVYFTSAMNYRQSSLASEFYVFESDVTMIKAVPDGLYIADSEATYWLSGGDKDEPGKYAKQQVLPYPVTPGTAINIPNSTDVAWFSTRGWCVGSAGGKAENRMEGNVVPSQRYEVGAAMFRENDSLRQLVSAVQGGADANSLRATDFVEAEVVRSFG